MQNREVIQKGWKKCTERRQTKQKHNSTTLHLGNGKKRLYPGNIQMMQKDTMKQKRQASKLLLLFRESFRNTGNVGALGNKRGRADIAAKVRRRRRLRSEQITQARSTTIGAWFLVLLLKVGTNVGTVLVLRARAEAISLSVSSVFVVVIVFAFVADDGIFLRSLFAEPRKLLRRAAIQFGGEHVLDSTVVVRAAVPLLLVGGFGRR